MSKRRFITDERALLEAYRSAEVYLLGLIRDATSRQAWGTARFHRRQYESLRWLIRNTERVIHSLGDATDEAVPQLVEHAYLQGKQAVGAGVLTAVDEAAISAMVVETRTALKSHLVQVARKVHDVYRDITQVAGSQAHTAGATHKQALTQALKQAADRGLTGFTDSAGRKWGMDTYLDMSLRTIRHRAVTQGKFNGWQAQGVHLVRISSHPACAPQCLPFQGKILALSGPAGSRIVVDHEGNGKVVQVAATMRDALARGYKHPNCRHVETAYLAGSDDTASRVTPERNQQEYEAEQRQRHNERQIRRWKRREAVAITPQEKAYTAEKIKQWQAIQRHHLKRSPFLSRQYQREQIRATN